MFALLRNSCSVSALILLVAACGGDSSSAGPASPPAVPEPAATTASFELIQSQILTPSCATAGCHVGTSAMGQLRLSADVAYDQLVGVKPSNANALQDGLLRVRPGKPDSSLLYHKLVFPAGHHARDYGNAMPTGTAGLSVGQLEFVRQWIAAGAPRTGKVVDAALIADKVPQASLPFAALAPPAAGTGFRDVCAAHRAGEGGGTSFDRHVQQHHEQADLLWSDQRR